MDASVGLTKFEAKFVVVVVAAAAAVVVVGVVILLLLLLLQLLLLLSSSSSSSSLLILLLMPLLLLLLLLLGFPFSYLLDFSLGIPGEAQCLSISSQLIQFCAAFLTAPRVVPAAFSSSSSGVCRSRRLFVSQTCFCLYLLAC